MINKSVFLACSIERAFALFTEHASEWWPAERRHTGDPRSVIRLLPSGRFWERAASGKEVELGHVRLWDPPRALTIDFFVGSDPDHPTEFFVSFAHEGKGTRLTLDHRPTEKSAEAWIKRAPAFETSWTLCLAGIERVALDHR